MSVRTYRVERLVDDRWHVVARPATIKESHMVARIATNDGSRVRIYGPSSQLMWDSQTEGGKP